jgi:hypothetical protein
MVLQALEGLSDREAAAQLRQNIAWKVACGWPDRPGLSSHGADLVAQQASSLRPARADLRGGPGGDRSGWGLGWAAAAGVGLHAAGRRGRHPGHGDPAGWAVRRVRRLHPAAAMLVLGAHDYDHDPGKPACAWDDAEARDQLVSGLVGDATTVLATLLQGSGWMASRPRRSACWPGGRPRRRARRRRGELQDRAQGWPPTGSSRWSTRRRGTCTRASAATAMATRRTWPSSPRRLVTAAALTPANAADGPTGVSLVAGERQGSRCWPTPPMAAARPARR